MAISANERAVLPLTAWQGALAVLGGFMGFHVMETHGMETMFRFTSWMLTAAIAGTLAGYTIGPVFRISGKTFFKAGFIFPGLALLLSDGSVGALAIGYGSFLGMTWGARHWLEMTLLQDGERDTYASRSGSLGVMCGIASTLVITLALSKTSLTPEDVFKAGGLMMVAGGLFLGNHIPRTRIVSLSKPLEIARQSHFIACLPLFFLESGMFGIGQAVGSAAAVHALGSAGAFGWVSTLAGMTGAIALYATRHLRDAHNRATWLGRSCAVIALAFALLGLSAWIPALFVIHAVLKSAGAPFLSASEQVLNQRALDIQGPLADRIVVREVVLWMFRMGSLALFWILLSGLPAQELLAAGAAMLAMATLLEYVVGRTLLRRAGRPAVADNVDIAGIAGFVDAAKPATPVVDLANRV
jgi:hypothetical protein